MGSNHEHGQHPAWVMISIHAPRMGSDNPACWSLGWRWIFQSTLPGWGATVVGTKYWISAYVFQSTLPGWGATRVWRLAVILGRIFQSTLPGWGATLHQRAQGDKMKISIHAPRMGSDHPDVDYLIVANQFQSTLPGWGATAKMDIFAHDMGKIIHFQH